MKISDWIVDKLIMWIPPCLGVVTIFKYLNTKREERNVFYLWPGENVEISDDEKVIVIVTRKGWLWPRIIVEFPNLKESKKRGKR